MTRPAAIRMPVEPTLGESSAGQGDGYKAAVPASHRGGCPILLQRVLRLVN